MTRPSWNRFAYQWTRNRIVQSFSFSNPRRKSSNHSWLTTPFSSGSSSSRLAPNFLGKTRFMDDKATDTQINSELSLIVPHWEKFACRESQLAGKKRNENNRSPGPISVTFDKQFHQILIPRSNSTPDNRATQGNGARIFPQPQHSDTHTYNHTISHKSIEFTK